MQTVSERLVSHGAAIFCCLALLITIGLAWNVVPIAPTPWYLNTSATASLLPGSTIIDTFSLRNEDYFALTGINGSNTVGFYRYKLGSAGWVGVNTTLGAIGWAYDNQRIWSTATVTVNPWTTVPYIIYVYSNNLVFQQYPLSDTAFDSSSTTAVGIAHTINLPTVVPNPHIVLHWVDNSTLVLGIHPYTVPNSGIQPAFIIGRFQINATNITQQTIHNRNLLVYSIEFECKLCSADNARLSFSDGTTRYLLRTGNTYSWSSPLSPLLQQYIHPELSHKCYNYTRNTTFLLFRAPLNKGINEAMFQKISDANFNIEFEYYTGPNMPSSISPYQMDIYCHAGDSYSARIINSSIITSDSEWRGRMNAHSKGKSEIVIYAISTIDTDYLENKVLILSTAGNDNVSRIYVDDSQFHVVGYTEGDIADPTVTSFSNKLFFAGFSTFDIVSVYSPGAVGNSFPFEILPGRDLAIRFSSLPANRMATFVPVITIMDVPCTNVRWIGEELFALAPPVLGLNMKLSVEFTLFPHIPRLFKSVSSHRPSVIDMYPTITDIAPFTTLRFTVLYIGWEELNATTIFVGDQKCEMQLEGVVPNFFSAIVIKCSVPFATIGPKFVNFTTAGRIVTDNVTLNYRMIPQNISITIDEGQETLILLKCSSYATLFNNFEYYIVDSPQTPYGRSLFENQTEFPVGSNVDVGDALGRMRFRSTSHGRVNFDYYCPERNLTLVPLIGSVVITIRPVIQCKNTAITTGNFVLDEKNSTQSNLTFTFLSVPSWGKLSAVGSGELFEQGDITVETMIRLSGRLSVNQSHVGSFSYIATNPIGTTSNLCEVGFVIACRAPLFLNIFNFTSDAFCSPCPVGATCSVNGEHFPFAAQGYWTRAGEYNPNNIFFPCVPASACPGLPSGECSAGFRGFRCGQCAPKYYKFGDDCLPCQTGYEMNTILAFVVIIGGGALAYGLSKLVKAGPTFGLVSVLISFLQTIVILRGFQLNWPPEFYAVLGWLSAINLNIEFTAPECFVGDFISYGQKLRVTLLLPIFLIIITVVWSNLIRAIGWIRVKLWRSKNSPPRSDQWKNDIFQSVNAILIFLYSTVATSSLSHFDCQLDVDGNYYLNLDASLNCYDSAWNTDLPFVILAVCIYVVGIPIYFSVMFYFMYQKRRNSKFWNDARLLASQIMIFDKFYHPDRQFFVLFNLLQKLALVAAGVFFTAQRGIQTVLTSLFLNATLFLSVVYKPYSVRILNLAEQLSYAASIAVLGLGLPFLTDSITNSVRAFLTFTILSVIFGFIIFIIVSCLIEAKARASSLRNKKTADAPAVASRQFLLVDESKMKV